MQEGINGTRCLPAPDGTIANPFGSSTYEIAKGWHATQCDPVSFICQNSEPCERGTIGTWPATNAFNAAPLNVATVQESNALKHAQRRPKCYRQVAPLQYR